VVNPESFGNPRGIPRSDPNLDQIFVFNKFMGEITLHYPVIRIVAVSSRYPAALDWGVDTLTKHWGSLFKKSPVFDFQETSYYEKSMGKDVQKQLLAFNQLMNASQLALTKHQSNDWEQQFKQSHSYPEDRPLNLDPGYLTQAKLILATTKDRDHRIYLDQGIYAEVTLFYKGKTWNSSRWTYPDYRRPEYHAFFDQCRHFLRQQLHSESSGD
jgi:hypothetical protein